MAPPTAMIMLAGIFYGAQYGGSTTAISSRAGETSSVVTCLDGHEMPKQGKAGTASQSQRSRSFLCRHCCHGCHRRAQPAAGGAAMKFTAVEYFSCSRDDAIDRRRVPPAAPSPATCDRSRGEHHGPRSIRARAG